MRRLGLMDPGLKKRYRNVIERRRDDYEIGRALVMDQILYRNRNRLVRVRIGPSGPFAYERFPMDSSKWDIPFLIKVPA